ncbi:MAG: GatB/YqeY domain-containing protein [Myxococcota bacterium]
MDLNARLEADMKAAMREKDALRLSAIRMLRAAVKNREIETGHALSDDEILPVVRTMAKQRRESIAAFEKGGRTALAEKEQSELAILEAYLPAAPSGTAIAKVVGEVITETGASSPRDMGRVMKECLARLGGAADGKQVSDCVRKALAKAETPGEEAGP